MFHDHYVFLNIAIWNINIFYKFLILFPSYMSKLTIFQFNFNLSNTFQMKLFE
jgi:hypothetical protein